MTWRFSMSTKLYGVYLCPSLFKLQFILDKIIPKTCDLSGINLWSLWRNCFGQLKSWSTIVKSKTFVFADSVLCLGGISTEPVQAWKDKIKWYFGDTPSQRFGSNRWGTNGIRVENCPRIHYIENLRRDSKHDGGTKVWTWAIHRKDHLHVNVQWHGMENTRKPWKLFGEFHECCSIRQEVPARMLVISGTLVMRKSGTELMSASQMVNGTKLLKSWCSTLLRAGIVCFVRPALWKKEN